MLMGSAVAKLELFLDQPKADERRKSPPGFGTSVKV